MKTQQQIKLFLDNCTLRNRVEILQQISNSVDIAARITPTESIIVRDTHIKLSHRTSALAKIEKDKTIEFILVELPISNAYKP